jgi:transglutaminase-like putative cysteine protease
VVEREAQTTLACTRKGAVASSEEIRHRVTGKRMGRFVLIFMAVMLSAGPVARPASGADLAQVRQLIEVGQWREANREIDRQLRQPGLDFLRRDALLFQQERMRRIQLDFPKTRDQVLAEARKILPGLEQSLFAQWERAGAVEFLKIDGRPCYFERAAGNLFRVSAEARALKEKAGVSTPSTPPHRLKDLRRVLAEYDKTGEGVSCPKTFRVTYRLTVKPGAVPAGEIIRAWLPFPQARVRQKPARLLTADPALYVRSPQTSALASVYFEKPAVAGQPTVFQLVYEYAASASHQRIEPARVRPVPGNDPALAPFLAEQPPQIAFDEQMRTLSREILAGESNAYWQARRIFQWINEHIPWAGAREYSTLESLPRYALEHRQGDCGIQTMLFITLCRLNGIPARWVSGWTTGPDKDMHDWCEIYLAPYGWVPADVSYGLVAGETERERWFHLGGIDSYRLVVNTDFAQPLFPAKSHFRSETVDFQRGEAEWRGGNLYFDRWDYELEVEDLPAATKTGGGPIPSGEAGGLN